MLQMNGKEVNNLVIAGQRFSAVKNTLIGTQVQVKKGQKAIYVGEAQTTSIGRFSTGTSTKDQLVEVKQCLYLTKTNNPDDGEYWIQALINFTNEENRIVYVSAPVFMRLSDVTIQNNLGGVNKPSYLLFIYELSSVEEVSPSCH